MPVITLREVPHGRNILENRTEVVQVKDRTTPQSAPTMSSKKQNKFSRVNSTNTLSTLSSISSSSLQSANDSMLAPPMTVGPNDVKTVYHMKNGGRLTVLQQKDDKSVIYELVHQDGRRVYLEKSPAGGVLIMTDQNGKPVKNIGCQY